MSPLLAEFLTFLDCEATCADPRVPERPGSDAGIFISAAALLVVLRGGVYPADFCDFWDFAGLIVALLFELPRDFMLPPPPWRLLLPSRTITPPLLMLCPTLWPCLFVVEDGSPLL